MVKSKTPAQTALCTEVFCDYLAELGCQPLAKHELLAHYVACRESRRGLLRWPNFASVMFCLSRARGQGHGKHSRRFICTLCCRSFADVASLRGHLVDDKEHVACARLECGVGAPNGEMPSVGVQYACPLHACEDQFPNRDQLLRHVTRKPHFLVYVEALANDSIGDLPSSFSSLSHVCLMCGRGLACRNSVKLHSDSCEYNGVFRTERAVLARGHGGIEVAFEGVQPLTIELQDKGAVHATIELSERIGTVLCTVKNVTDEAFLLHSCTFNLKLLKFSMTWRDPSMQRPGMIGGKCQVLIEGGRSYVLQLTASNFTNYGYFPGVVQLGLRKINDNKLVSIVTPVNLRVVSPEYALLQPTTKFTPRERPAAMSTTILDGVPPDRPSNNNLTYVLPLKRYEVPPDVRDPKQNRQRINAIRQPLSEETYESKFSSLLYFEEHQMEQDITRYTISCTTMKKDGLFLILEVPGLAEKRPSVLRGDTVKVAMLGTDLRPESTKAYRGHVHHVELNALRLRFHSDLMMRFIDRMLFMVEFSFNRLPMKLSHRGVEMAGEHNLMMVVFPRMPNPMTVATRLLSQLSIDGSLRFYNKLMEQNKEQQRAVKAIVDGSSVPAPYLIFGPPGTGKTMTLVEAIKQVYFIRKESHILACAPQNEAADLIADRLLDHIPKHDMIRLNATSRQKTDISSKKVADIANYGADGEVYYPSTSDLLLRRVIVCTLVTAGRLVSSDMGRSVFTHIFIDEAGHAIEPEAMIPISGLLKVEEGKVVGQLVLAGDPKQLGPVIRSPQALRHGLSMSLLERLMCERELYQRSHDSGCYNNCVLTKLVNNYRSHPDILLVPNQLFYDDELQVCADEVERTKFCRWSELPAKGFPILVHGVHGKDEQEGDSPSFFNIDEATCVAEYAQKILELKAPKVLPQHIGIIAPYRKQVQKIRLLLQDKDKKASPNLGLSNIKVGSVEEFQGQERSVIIISTVRSTQPEYMKIDLEYNLGFLKNPKRFNVAVTRAKSLLIVIGNPDLLAKDESWNRFIKYCRSRGGVKPVDMFSALEGDSTDDEMGNTVEGPGEDREPGYRVNPGYDGVVQGVLDPEWRGHL